MKRVNKVSIEKRKLVIDEWFANGFNKIDAYKKFFPKVTKDVTARVNFSRMLADNEIKKYVDLKYEEAAKVIKATHESVLRELLNWLELDVTETIGLTKDELKLLPIKIRRAISKHKYAKKSHYDREGNLLHVEETITIGFVSKEKTIDMINKHIGFYEADNKQGATQINITATNDKHKDLIQGIIDGK